MRFNRSLKYGRDRLVKTLRENRAKHTETYTTALKEYKKAVITELEKNLVLAKEGKQIGHVLDLRMPEQHTADYDRAIEMFSLTTEQEIELDQDTFCQLVMDEWNWKNSFTSNTVSYAAAAIG